MTKIHSRLSVIAISIGALCFCAAPSFAQRVGNSNYGGVNNSNFNGFSGSSPNFGGSSAAFQQAASSLQSRLAAAQAAVRASGGNPSTTGDGVRRFVRNAGTCNCCNCSTETPEQVELKRVRAEAAAFLEEMKGRKIPTYNPAW